MLENREVAARTLELLKALIGSAERLRQSASNGDYVELEHVADEMMQPLQDLRAMQVEGVPLPRTESVADSVKRIRVHARARSHKTLPKIEFELLPLLKEYYHLYYFFNCVYPDKALMENYYSNEMVPLGANGYIDEAVRTGRYRYDLSVAVLAFNKLEYTKLCVESILKHIPQGLNYELILINHGSSDGTREYFESIAPTKQIDILVNGGGFGAYTRYIEGKYFLLVSNDVVVTENAIPNMLRCMESDEKIAWVVPTTPNVSNLQTIHGRYETLDEMHDFARQNNGCVDPFRWEQRVRLCDPISLCRTSAAYSSVGVHWSYYIHTDMHGGYGFMDDKQSLFYRRNGYKMMLAKDSFCHHFGSVTLREDLANQEAFYERGRAAFRAAFGVDPWGTGSCWSTQLMSLLPCREKGPVNILGVNCGLGSNPLKIRESIKENVRNLDVRIYNVTDDAGFEEDLKGVSDEVAVVGDCGDSSVAFPSLLFDYIVVESGLEAYRAPADLINALAGRLSPRGFLAVQTPEDGLRRMLRGRGDAAASGDWTVLGAPGRGGDGGGAKQRKGATDGEGPESFVADVLRRSADLNLCGDFEAALKTLVEAIMRVPDTGLYAEVARLLIDEKQFAEGLEALEQIKNGKDDPVILSLRGHCLEGLDRPEEALRCADAALSSDPGSALALNLRGVLAHKAGDRVAAEAYFRKAAEADAGFGEPYTNLGILRWAASSHDEALDLLERGAALSPNVPDSLSAYFTAVRAVGRQSRAVAFFRRLLSAAPRNKRVSFLLIDALLQAGDLAGAMSATESVMLDFGIEGGILAAALELREKTGPHTARQKPGQSVSVCMIVRNEEARLPRCLASVRDLAAEFIVVDTGSSDRTKAVARAFGAKVFDAEWTGDFSAARNVSIEKAAGDWIFVLDADEVISPGDIPRLRKLIRKNANNPPAFAITTRNYVEPVSVAEWRANKGEYPEEAGTGWYPSKKVRLFPRRAGIRFSNPVHELVEPSARQAGLPIQDCAVPVHHYGKLDMQKVMAKGEEYFLLGREKLRDNAGDPVALAELAVQAGEINRYDDAVDLWSRVIALAPGDAKAHHNLGYALLQLGRYEESLQASLRALRLAPDMKEAVINYAVASFSLGDTADATARLEELHRRDPSYAAAMVLLAQAYLAGGDRALGVHYAERLRGAGVDFVEYVGDQVRHLLTAGRIDHAISLLKAVTESVENGRRLAPLLEECRARNAELTATGTHKDL